MVNNLEEASDYVWLLHIRYCAMKKRVEAFENGHAYQVLLKYVDHVTSVKNAEVKAAKREAVSFRNEMISSRRAWSQIFDDQDREHANEMKLLQKEILRLQEKVLLAERQRDEAKDREKEWRDKYYGLADENEELKGKNKKLTAQVNKDFQNSSIPSSQQGPGRKKIPNSRQNTGRKRGGQPGHEGHRLQQRTPDETHHLPDPEEFLNDPDYYPTGETVKRQKVFTYVQTRVIEYTATVFRNRKTGSRVHATFPEGYDTDISYDGSVKGFAYLLNTECNVSLGKTTKFMREMSLGKITLSNGKVCDLIKEFAQKTDKEKQTIINDIMTSPVVNADFTNANVNGQSKQVLIIASPSKDVALYCACDSKGHKGIQGTPLEHYVGTIVHDHDTTFYSYGLAHQECSQHNDRYLTGSEENEPEFQWNKQMHDLLKRMLDYRRNLGDVPPDPITVKVFEDEYDEILLLAKKEYEDEPPSDYYREGYNLYRRLVEYKDSELLFLHDKNVPPDNSLAERLARVFKRKQKQMMVFRSDKNFMYICDGLSVLKSMRNGEENAYIEVSNIFNREKPKKKAYIK